MSRPRKSAVLVLAALPVASSVAPAFAEEREQAYEDRVAAALAPVPGGLTAEKAAALAAGIAPRVALQDAEIDISEAQRFRTLARFAPIVNLSASATYTNAIVFDFSGQALSVGALNPGLLTVGNCPGGVGDNCVVDSAGQPVGAVAGQPFEIPRRNYVLQGDVRIPLSDYLLALSPARRASAADVDAAELRRTGEVEEVELEARVAFYEWLRSKAQIAVAEQALAAARARLADARLGLEQGTLAQVDVLQLESLEASSQVALESARSFEQVARANLAEQLGVDGASLSVGEDIFGEPAEAAVTLDRALEIARRNRAELRGLEQAITSAREAARGASVEQLPRLDAVGTVIHANPNQQFFPPAPVWNTSWSIGLMLSWGLDRFLSARAQTRELEAVARRSEAQRAQTTRAITLEVTSAWEAFQRALVSVRLSRVEVDAAEGAYNQRVALYQAGEATTTEIIEAEVARFDASLSSVNARIELRIARAQLERAVGRDRGR